MEKKERYSRQMLFSAIGAKGQERIQGSHVTIIGCGALGSGIAHILGRAGVGHLRIVDRDSLETSNLHRQMLFDEEDVRQCLPKSIAAAKRLGAINSEIEVEPVVADVTPANVLSLIEGSDAVADGSDNMEVRFILNDACVKTGTPWVYGGAVAASGMTMTIRPGFSPCLRCVLEERPAADALATCDLVGVINTLTTLLSAIEANEIVKLLLSPEEASKDLLRFDIWTLDFRKTHVERRSDCPACGLGKYEYLEAGGARGSKRLGFRKAVQVTPDQPRNVDLARLAESLRTIGTVEYNTYFVRLVLPNMEFAVFPDGRTIVRGITDECVARSLVERYIGL